MKLSMFTDYSLRVLMYAAVHEEELITTQQVGTYFGISYNHLVKVVHRLSTAGYLEVQKGRNGGFRLAMPPGEIRVGAVVRDVEPDFNFVECHAKDTNRCVVTPFCRLKRVIDTGMSAFMESLDRTTIEELVVNDKKKWKAIAT
jgi:Rrf2 family transcriptional regulator, nitric oxide-sensitive transcriptional repressor